MNADWDAQLEREAAERKAKAIEVTPEPEGETLEVVRPLPPEDPSAYR